MSDCVRPHEYACVQCALDLQGPCAADPTFGLCLGCHAARYCSPACQRDAWCVFIAAHKPAFAKLPLHTVNGGNFSHQLKSQNGRPGHKQACKKTRKECAAAAENTAADAAVNSAGKDAGANPADAKRTASAPSAINADAAADLCAHCTAAPGLLVCLGCHQAGYCSLTCQQGAWWVVLAFSVRSNCIQFTQVSNCGWCVASCVQGGPQESLQGRAQRAGDITGQ